MEKILITGATGLIGQELLSLLINEYECWVVGRHTAENPKWHFIEQDMGKVFEINKFPEQMDYIIHLAQSDGHNDFKNNRKEIFDVNIYGMMQLLDYGVKAKIKKYLFASSGGIYGQLGKPAVEDESIVVSDSLNFYQNTKLCTELLARNYGIYFNVIAFRFFFVYGKGQKDNMLFPRMIKSIKEKRIITVGSLNDIKINPIYKTDAAMCVYMALKGINDTETFNIAGDEITSLGNIALKIAKEIGTEIEVRYENEQQQDVLADIRKMRKLLWTPQITLDEGLGRMLSD